MAALNWCKGSSMAQTSPLNHPVRGLFINESDKRSVNNDLLYQPPRQPPSFIPRGYAPHP
jgi:hypothetical protein